MQIWVDAQLSPTLAKWINEHFQEVRATALRDIDLRDAADLEIFRKAKAENAVVMTKDFDFVHLLKLFGPPPQIIWITVGNTSNLRMQDILEQHLRAVIKLLLGGESLVEISGT